MTKIFEDARSAYLRAYPDSPFFDTWVPQEKFLQAEFDGDGNGYIAREDDGIYGMAFGSSPEIPQDWKNFSIESRGIAQLPHEFKAVTEWDCYWAPTSSEPSFSTDSASDDEIKSFLEAHAPHSSVFPGNDEIEKWIVIRKGGELMAVAAICKWESGRFVISSVASHSEHRGEGLGREVMRASMKAGHEMGTEILCLGVMHSNTSAQRLYLSLGFRLMHNFTYCERR